MGGAALAQGQFGGAKQTGGVISTSPDTGPASEGSETVSMEGSVPGTLELA